MRARRTGVVFVVSVYVVAGVAFGLVGLVSMLWAQAQFVAEAGGSSPGEFGPVLLAVVYFQTTVAFLIAAPLLGAATGAMAGSRFRSGREAAAVGGGGGALGCVIMLLLSIGGASLVSGAGTGQLYAIGAAVVPALVATAAAGVTGGVGGLLGSLASR